MTTPANAFVLAKHQRLFVGKTATATADADFVLIENENEIEVSWKADKEKISTKSKGKITLPEGDEEWTIKVTVDQALVDSGFPLLLNTMQADYPVQVRDTKANKVVVEGRFTATDATIVKAGTQNVRQTMFTLENSDVVTLNLATGGRAVAA